MPKPIGKWANDISHFVADRASLRSILGKQIVEQDYIGGYLLNLGAFRVE